MEAQKFREHLARAGVTQSQFSKWLKLDLGTVNRWYWGRRAIPPYAAILVEVLATVHKFRKDAKKAE
jgi:DNA-binding transcriptional regulator YiaG